jgi:ribosomal protein L7/L12
MKITIELEMNESNKLLELIASHIPAEAIGAAIANKVPEILDRLPKPAPEGDTLNLRIVHTRGHLIDLIKAIRTYYGSGLKETKDFVDGNGPRYINMPRAQAIALQAELINFNCDVELT